jgi:hypothetical protein
MRRPLRPSIATRALLAVAGCCATSLLSAQPVKVGEEVALPRILETAHPYPPSGGPGAVPVWSEVVHHPGATYVQPHFARFQLAAGDRVVVRSPAGEQSWPYEGLGRAGLGLDPRGFWSSRILGDTAVIELFAGPGSKGWGLSIDRYTRGFDQAEIELANPGTPTSICGVDDSEWAKCYETSEPEIYDRSRAVARIHLPSGSSCTGWLLGCEGHLVTNNHCIGTPFDAQNTDYEFMAEGATCATSCTTGAACPGPIEATTATLIDTDVALDYTLVKLPANITPTYGYLQLRDTGPQLDERIYIPGHPAGWGKRISVFSTHATDASGLCEVNSLSAPPCTGGPGDIGYYCDTQGGSSGSPVLAYADHRVVSLHHCGSCTNRGLDIVDVIASLGSNLPQCAIEQLAGTVEFDQGAYSCSDTAQVTVIDDSIQGAGSQVVTVTSSSEPAPETVVLAEQELGQFVGSIATGAPPAIGGDGVVSIVHGDTLTVEYIDADDGVGGTNVPRQATAVADCAPPGASNVKATSITASSATVSWQTSEASSGAVTYGTAPPGSSTEPDDVFAQSHGVPLTGLTDCTQYYYSVTSTDALGNSGTDTNGGAFFKFKTLCLPPVPIPDGAGDSTGILVDRLALDGSELAVSWDESCSPFAANLLWGALEQVSTWAVGGAVCSVGQPAAWSAVPAADVWFLLVGEAKNGLESSWGDATSGERHALTSSGQCGVTFKNTLLSCP